MTSTLAQHATLLLDDHYGTYASSRGASLTGVLGKLLTGQTIKVTFIGDSGLFGTGVDATTDFDGNTVTAGVSGTDDIASLVCSTLAARYGVTVTKSNRAVGGRTVAANLQNGVLTAAVADNPDLVVISHAHNDIRSDLSSPGTGYPLAASQAGVEFMIRWLRRNVPNADILVLSEWPYNQGSGSDAKVVLYNQAMQRIAASYACEFADGYSYFPSPNPNPYIAGGASANHPNKLGHAAWAQAVTDRFPVASIYKGGPRSLWLPEKALWGADRYDRRGWTTTLPYATNVLARNANVDGYALNGTFTGTGGAFWQTSTVNDTIEMQFIGTEAEIRLDTGTGAPTVRIEVDGTYVYSALDLSAFDSSTQQRSIPLTGLAHGTHKVIVTMTTAGTLTFRGLDVLNDSAEWIPAASTRITFTGTWGSLTTDIHVYNRQYRSSTTQGDSISFSFIGTGFGINLAARYPTAHSLALTIDGVTSTSASIAYGTGVGTATEGSVVLASGLTYGRHTVTIASNGTRPTFQVAGVFVFDENRLARPRTQRGLAMVGETVAFGVPFGQAPTVMCSPADANSTAPPYASAVTATGFTVAGTASALVLWEANADIIAA